jgi:hypothetical protein
MFLQNEPSAPRRRVSPVEEDSTSIVAGLIESLQAVCAGNQAGRSPVTKAAVERAAGRNVRSLSRPRKLQCGCRLAWVSGRPCETGKEAGQCTRPDSPGYWARHASEAMRVIGEVRAGAIRDPERHTWWRPRSGVGQLRTIEAG